MRWISDLIGRCWSVSADKDNSALYCPDPLKQVTDIAQKYQTIELIETYLHERKRCKSLQKCAKRISFDGSWQ